MGTLEQCLSPESSVAKKKSKEAFEFPILSSVETAYSLNIYSSSVLVNYYLD